MDVKKRKKKEKAKKEKEQKKTKEEKNIITNVCSYLSYEFF